MTTYYVDNAGSNTSTYDTWAKAATTLAVITAIDGAGDTVYIRSTHTESTASSVTFAFAGTTAAPSKLICGTNGAAPPTTYANTAAIAVTGTNGDITITGGTFIDGVNFSCGDSTNRGRIIIGSANRVQVYRNCDFILAGNNSGGYINISNGIIVWENCDVKFAHASQIITMVVIQSIFFHWKGGSILAGGTAPTGGLFKMAGTFVIEGVDLTELGANPLFTDSTIGAALIVFKNCKLAANATLVSGTLIAGDRVEVYNTDSADTNYRMNVQDYYGTIDHELTVLRSGGATDGVTAISWKMVSSANANYYFPLRTSEIVIWNTVDTGTITVTVEVATNNVTLTNAECWLEVDYQGTASYPKGVWINDSTADSLTAGTNQDTSAVTWASVPGTPVKQYLRCTLSPTGPGFIHARVCLGKASTTVYVDPKVTVA